MGGVTGNDEQEGFDDSLQSLAGIGFQLHLDALVEPDTVFQFQPLDLFHRHSGRIEVLAGHHRRFLDKAVAHGPAQGIVVNDVLKRHAALIGFYKGGGGQLQAEDWFQLVDGPHSGAGPVAVRLVHEQDQIRQARQIIEITLADIFGEPLDAWRFAAPDLGVDFGDIEDVDVDAILPNHPRNSHLSPSRLPHPHPAFVGVAGDHRRRFSGELSDSLEHIFRRVRGEIGNQLVVDGEIRRQHEEIADPVGQMQVADKGPHESGLANAGGQGKAKRGKFPLKIGDRRIFAADDLQHGGGVRLLARRRNLGDAVQNFQGFPLRLPQGQPAGDGVDVTVHGPTSFRCSCCKSMCSFA